MPKRRVSRPTGDHPFVGDDKVVKLRKLFDRALPLIHVQSFTYVLMVTMLRSVLILNGIYDYGRNIWSGDTEGTDFLRFCAVLYTVVGAPGIELLRGGAVPPAAVMWTTRLTGHHQAYRSPVHGLLQPA